MQSNIETPTRGPVGWAKARLRFKASINPKSSIELEPTAAVSFLPMDAIGDDGALRLDQTRVVSEVSQGYTYFENNDVSIAKITPCFENGKGAVMRELVGGAGFGTTELIVLRPEEDVDPCFLYYLTQSDHFRDPGEAAMLGAGGQKRVPDLYVKDFETAWPSRSVQAAIASYLDAETARIDGLIEAKSELLALLKGFDSTAFFSALCATAEQKDGRPDEQVRWLPSLPKAWGRCKVKHLVISFDQGVSPQCESRVPDEDEWGVLKVGCVNSGSFDPLESKALPPEIPPVPEVVVEAGDLLISRANTKDLVGRSAVAMRSFQKLMLSDKLYRLKLDLTRCYPEFVRRLLWVPAVRQLIEERATGASPSMLNIDRRTILEIPVPLPSLKEQELILQEAEKASSSGQGLIRHVEREIELLRELRAASITDAVLGRIDIREHMKN